MKPLHPGVAGRNQVNHTTRHPRLSLMATLLLGQPQPIQGFAVDDVGDVDPLLPAVNDAKTHRVVNGELNTLQGSQQEDRVWCRK